MAIYKITNSSLCCGCGACMNICVQSAIVLKENSEGFKYPVINREKCIDCNVCRKICPANKRIENMNKPDVFAARTKDKIKVLSSSSGGIFGEIAEECIKKGGAVYGVIIDTDFNVRHSCATSLEDAELFKGSKYVQSELGSVYKEVKEMLVSNRYVVFSGTPCQVNGLKNYLGTEYDTLITVDFVCHGVPSPLVFKKYIELKQREFRSPLREIKFRDKKTGWSKYCVTFSSSDEETSEIFYENPYMYGFLHNIFLRESCYNCVYKGKFSQADLTLADYWGAEGKLVDTNSDNGLSLVFVNTDKGQKWFDIIRSNIDYEKKYKEDVIKVHNKHYEESSIMSKNRHKFWKVFIDKGMKRALHKYCRDPLYYRIYFRLRKMVKKYFERLQGIN